MLAGGGRGAIEGGSGGAFGGVGLLARGAGGGIVAPEGFREAGGGRGGFLPIGGGGFGFESGRSGVECVVLGAAGRRCDFNPATLGGRGAAEEGGKGGAPPGGLGAAPFGGAGGLLARELVSGSES